MICLETESLMLNTRRIYGKLYGTMLVLRLTSKCNMHCAYCYASNDECDEKSEVILDYKLIQYMLKNIADEKPAILHVIFTGGEPLICKDLIKKVVDFIKELSINYSISILTNGSLLDESFLKYIKKEDISLVVSLDGPTLIQNMYRTGGNTVLHDKILNNIVLAVSMKVKISINSVLNSENIGHLKDMVDFCIENRINDFSLLPISNVGRAQGNFNHAISNIQLFEAIKELTNYLIKVNQKKDEVKVYERNIDLQIKKLIDPKPCPGCASSPCGAGTTMLALDVNGDIYPCDQFIGDKRFVIGNAESEAFEKDFVNSMGVYMLAFNNKDRSPSCNICENNIYCSGGCLGDNIFEYNMPGFTNTSNWCEYYGMLYPMLKNLISEDTENIRLLSRG